MKLYAKICEHRFSVNDRACTTLTMHRAYFATYFIRDGQRRVVCIIGLSYQFLHSRICGPCTCHARARTHSLTHSSVKYYGSRARISMVLVFLEAGWRASLSDRLAEVARRRRARTAAATARFLQRKGAFNRSIKAVLTGTEWERKTRITRRGTGRSYAGHFKFAYRRS